MLRGDIHAFDGFIVGAIFRNILEVSALSYDALHWRHNDHDGVSNHQPHGCFLNRLLWRRSKKTSKLRVTGLCAGNSPGPVNSPHKGRVTRKMFPFDDVIMRLRHFLQQVTVRWSHHVTSVDRVQVGRKYWLTSFVKPVTTAFMINWRNEFSYNLVSLYINMMHYITDANISDTIRIS